jgi:tRNA G10  N-methylase Trm11
VEYSLDRILADLLEFAAQQLALGGRVVFWLPVIRHNYKVTLMPACSPKLCFVMIFVLDG